MTFGLCEPKLRVPPQWVGWKRFNGRKGECSGPGDSVGGLGLWAALESGDDEFHGHECEV